MSNRASFSAIHADDEGDSEMMEQLKLKRLTRMQTKRRSGSLIVKKTKPKGNLLNLQKKKDSIWSPFKRIKKSNSVPVLPQIPLDLAEATTDTGGENKMPIPSQYNKNAIYKDLDDVKSKLEEIHLRKTNPTMYLKKQKEEAEKEKQEEEIKSTLLELSQEQDRKEQKDLITPRSEDTHAYAFKKIDKGKKHNDEKEDENPFDTTDSLTHTRSAGSPKTPTIIKAGEKERKREKRKRPKSSITRYKKSNRRIFFATSNTEEESYSASPNMKPHLYPSSKPSPITQNQYILEQDVKDSPVKVDDGRTSAEHLIEIEDRSIPSKKRRVSSANVTIRKKQQKPPTPVKHTTQRRHSVMGTTNKKKKRPGSSIRRASTAKTAASKHTEKKRRPSTSKQQEKPKQPVVLAKRRPSTSTKPRPKSMTKRPASSKQHMPPLPTPRSVVIPESQSLDYVGLTVELHRLWNTLKVPQNEQLEFLQTYLRKPTNPGEAHRQQRVVLAELRKLRILKRITLEILARIDAREQHVYMLAKMAYYYKKNPSFVSLKNVDAIIDNVRELTLSIAELIYTKWRPHYQCWLPFMYRQTNYLIKQHVDLYYLTESELGKAYTRTYPEKYPLPSKKCPIVEDRRFGKHDDPDDAIIASGDAVFRKVDFVSFNHHMSLKEKRSHYEELRRRFQYHDQLKLEMQHHLTNHEEVIPTVIMRAPQDFEQVVSKLDGSPLQFKPPKHSPQKDPELEIVPQPGWFYYAPLSKQDDLHIQHPLCSRIEKDLSARIIQDAYLAFAKDKKIRVHRKRIKAIMVLQRFVRVMQARLAFQKRLETVIQTGEHLVPVWFAKPFLIGKAIGKQKGFHRMHRYRLFIALQEQWSSLAAQRETVCFVQRQVRHLLYDVIPQVVFIQSHIRTHLLLRQIRYVYAAQSLQHVASPASPQLEDDDDDSLEGYDSEALSDDSLDEILNYDPSSKNVMHLGESSSYQLPIPSQLPKSSEPSHVIDSEYESYLVEKFGTLDSARATYVHSSPNQPKKRPVHVNSLLPAEEGEEEGEKIVPLSARSMGIDADLLSVASKTPIPSPRDEEEPSPRQKKSIFSKLIPKRKSSSPLRKSSSPSLFSRFVKSKKKKEPSTTETTTEKEFEGTLKVVINQCHFYNQAMNHMKAYAIIQLSNDKDQQRNTSVSESNTSWENEAFQVSVTNAKEQILVVMIMENQAYIGHVQFDLSSLPFDRPLKVTKPLATAGPPANLTTTLHALDFGIKKK